MPRKSIRKPRDFVVNGSAEGRLRLELRKLTNSEGWVSTSQPGSSNSSRSSTPNRTLNSTPNPRLTVLSRPRGRPRKNTPNEKKIKRPRGRPPHPDSEKKFKMVLEKDDEFEVDYLTPDEEEDNMSSYSGTKDDYSDGEGWADSLFNHSITGGSFPSTMEVEELEEEDFPPLDLPPSSDDLLISNELLIQALSIYEILRHFRTILRLSPFVFEDFCAALLSKDTNVLLNEIHISLLKAILKDEDTINNAFVPPDQKDSQVAVFYFIDYLTWPDVLKSFLASSPEFSYVGDILNDPLYPCVGIKEKLKVLELVSNLYIGTTKIRDKLMMDGTIRYDDHCRVCHKLGDLLCCETCSAVYHLACCNPKLKEVPDEEWLCEVCVAHKLDGVTNCENESEFHGQYLRHDSLGVDRHGRKYWFLARRLIVNGKDGTKYYSTNAEIQFIFSKLDAEKYESQLCDAIQEVLDEVPRQCYITESLTNTGKWPGKTVIDNIKERTREMIEEIRIAEEKKAKEDEEKRKKTEEEEIKAEEDRLREEKEKKEKLKAKEKVKNIEEEKVGESEKKSINVDASATDEKTKDVKTMKREISDKSLDREVKETENAEVKDEVAVEVKAIIKSEDPNNVAEEKMDVVDEHVDKKSDPADEKPKIEDLVEKSEPPEDTLEKNKTLDDEAIKTNSVISTEETKGEKDAKNTENVALPKIEKADNETNSTGEKENHSGNDESTVNGESPCKTPVQKSLFTTPTKIETKTDTTVLNSSPLVKSINLANLNASKLENNSLKLPGIKLANISVPLQRCDSIINSAGVNKTNSSFKVGQSIQVKTTPSPNLTTIKNLFVLNKNGKRTPISVGPGGKIIAGGPQKIVFLNRRNPNIKIASTTDNRQSRELKKLQFTGAGPKMQKILRFPINNQVANNSSFAQQSIVKPTPKPEEVAVPEPQKPPFKLGEDSSFLRYKNHYVDNPLALNKYQHKEEKDKERQVGHKFSLGASVEFEWGGKLFGSQDEIVHTLRCSLFKFEQQIPLCFMHGKWEQYRKMWGHMLLQNQSAKAFAAVLGILEMAIKDCAKRPVWKDSMGQCRMRRLTIAEKDDYEKKKKFRAKIEEDIANMNAVWCKYPLPVKSMLVWKMKGEEYRVTGYGGWMWLSSTFTLRNIRPKPPLLIPTPPPPTKDKKEEEERDAKKEEQEKMEDSDGKATVLGDAREEAVADSTLGGAGVDAPPDTDVKKQVAASGGGDENVTETIPAEKKMDADGGNAENENREAKKDDEESEPPQKMEVEENKTDTNVDNSSNNDTPPPDSENKNDSESDPVSSDVAKSVSDLEKEDAELEADLIRSCDVIDISKHLLKRGCIYRKKWKASRLDSLLRYRILQEQEKKLKLPKNSPEKAADSPKDCLKSEDDETISASETEVSDCDERNQEKLSDDVRKDPEKVQPNPDAVSKCANLNQSLEDNLTKNGEDVVSKIEDKSSSNSDENKVENNSPPIVNSAVVSPQPKEVIENNGSELPSANKDCEDKNLEPIAENEISESDPVKRKSEQDSERATPQKEEISDSISDIDVIQPLPNKTTPKIADESDKDSTSRPSESMEVEEKIICNGVSDNKDDAVVEKSVERTTTETNTVTTTVSVTENRSTETVTTVTTTSTVTSTTVKNAPAAENAESSESTATHSCTTSMKDYVKVDCTSGDAVRSSVSRISRRFRSKVRVGEAVKRESFGEETRRSWKLKTKILPKKKSVVKMPLPWKFTTGKGKKRNLFRLPKSCVRFMAIRAGLTWQPFGFHYVQKTPASLELFWPYPCARPTIGTCWRYKLQNSNTLASIAHLLKMLWHSMRWDEIVNRPSHDENYHVIHSDESIVTTELLKRRNVGNTGLKSEYFVRRIVMPNAEEDEEIPHSEAYTPSSRSGLRTRSRPMNLRERSKKDADLSPKVEEVWLAEDSVELWQIRQFDSMFREQQKRAQVAAERGKQTTVFPINKTPIRVNMQNTNKQTLMPNANQQQTKHVTITTALLKQAAALHRNNSSLLASPLSSQQQVVNSSSLQVDSSSLLKLSDITKPGHKVTLTPQSSNTQKIIPVKTTPGSLKSTPNQGGTIIQTGSGHTFFQAKTGTQYIMQGNKVMPRQILLRGGSQLASISPQTSSTVTGSKVVANNSSLPTIRLQPSQTVNQPQVITNVAPTVVQETPVSNTSNMQVKLSAAQLAKLMKVSIGTIVRVSVALNDGSPGIGQLQVIPPGAQVLPSPGQQLMQCKVGNDVRRFLLTALSGKAETPSPTVIKSTPPTQQPQQQPAPGPARQPVTAATKSTSEYEASLKTLSLRDRLEQLQRKQQQILRQGSGDVRRLLTDKDPLWGGRNHHAEDKQGSGSEKRRDSVHKKKHPRESREEAQRKTVVQQVMKSMLDRIERKEELESRRRRRELKEEQHRRKKESMDEARSQQRLHSRLVHTLRRHQDQLKQEIRKRKTITEKYLTWMVENELHEDKIKLKKRRPNFLIESKPAPSSSRKSGGYLTTGSALNSILTESNRKRSPKKVQKRPRKRTLSSEKVASLQSPPPPPKKKRMISTSTKLYCVCKTPYDETRFYIGCDLCMNWFHGECVGISEKTAKLMENWCCAECEQTKPKQELYCICRTPYDDAQFYIGCDACQDWYHGACVGILEEEASKIESYTCPKCRKNQRDASQERALADRDFNNLMKIVKQLQSHKMAWPFLEPVREKEAPGYYKVVKRPMDLQTVMKRLQCKYYIKLSEFVGDVSLIFDNCRQFNGADSKIVRCAEIVETVFVGKMRDLRGR